MEEDITLFKKIIKNKDGSYHVKKIIFSILVDDYQLTIKSKLTLVIVHIESNTTTYKFQGNLLYILGQSKIPTDVFELISKHPQFLTDHLSKGLFDHKKHNNHYIITVHFKVGVDSYPIKIKLDEENHTSQSKITVVDKINNNIDDMRIYYDNINQYFKEIDTLSYEFNSLCAQASRVTFTHAPNIDAFYCPFKDVDFNVKGYSVPVNRLSEFQDYQYYFQRNLHQMLIKTQESWYLKEINNLGDKSSVSWEDIYNIIKYQTNHIFHKKKLEYIIRTIMMVDNNCWFPVKIHIAGLENICNFNPHNYIINNHEIFQTMFYIIFKQLNPKIKKIDLETVGSMTNYNAYLPVYDWNPNDIQYIPKYIFAIPFKYHIENE